MATTKTELLNNGVVVATKTASPFYSWDWTPSTSGASSLTYKRYEDNVLVYTSGAITGTVEAPAAFTDVASISPEYMWHKFNAASVNTGTSPFKTSIDGLTQTPWNITSQYDVTIATINGKEYAYANNREFFTAISPASMFTNTFSIFFELLPNDGHPATSGSIFYHRDAAIENRFEVSLNNVGKLLIIFKAANLDVVSVTSVSEIFPDGVIATGKKVAVVFNKESNTVAAYLDGVEIALTTNNIVGSRMTNYVNTTTMKVLSTTMSCHYRNIIIQPVAYTQSNVDNLNTL